MVLPMCSSLGRHHCLQRPSLPVRWTCGESPVQDGFGKAAASGPLGFRHALQSYVFCDICENGLLAVWKSSPL